MTELIAEDVMSEKKRESNFELLRIVAMVFIVFGHICMHTPAVFEQRDSWFTFIGNFSWFGSIGNNCFMLISGWFLSKSKFTWKKWLLLYSELYIYWVVIGVAMFMLGESSKFGLVKCFLPMTFPEGWYAWYLRTYLVFYLFVPFLNKLLRLLSKREHFLLCALLFAAGYVLPSIPYGSFSTGHLYGFFASFFIASYIRLFEPKLFRSQKRNVFILVLLIFALFARQVLAKALSEAIPYFFVRQQILYSFFSPFLTFSTAFFFFVVFKNLKIGCIKAINIFASTTLGVYLIHEHKNIPHFLWNRIFKLHEVSPRWMFFPRAVAITFATFAACAAVDLVRQRLLERPLAKYADRIDRFVRAKTAA